MLAQWGQVGETMDTHNKHHQWGDKWGNVGKNGGDHFFPLFFTEIYKSTH